jgi:hypothetical protein
MAPINELDRFRTVWNMEAQLTNHLLESLPADQFARTLLHPERGPMSLDDVLAMYEWHSRHHVAHVTALREREGW